MKKHIRAKPPVQLPKEAQKMTALNHPNVDQGQLFGANVSSTRPKQASKVQFLSPKFPGVTQPGTPENHGSVLLFTTKTQNRNCALATFFCFCTCVCFGPEIGPIGAWTSPSDDGRAGKLLAAGGERGSLGLTAAPGRAQRTIVRERWSPGGGLEGGLSRGGLRGA